MTILVQHGWGKSGKIEQGIAKGLVEGVVMSPRDETPDKLASFLSSTRNSYPKVELLADPQAYIGAIGPVRRSKFDQYPQYRQGLIPASFSPAVVRDVVGDTLAWQDSLDVTAVLSPTVLVDDLGSRWAQIALMLAQETVFQHRGAKPLLISVLVGEDALRQRTALDGWLDDLTQLNVDGFYLVVRRTSETYRQQVEPEVLAGLLLACYSLGEVNQYRVFCGYTDMLTLLLHAVGVTGTASGWFANLRQFTLSRFLPTSGGRRPRPRYTSRPLLNSIYLTELDSVYIGRRVTNVLSATQYDRRFNGSITPENVPWPEDEAALHHWNVLRDTAQSLVGVTVGDRLNSVQNLISQALAVYGQISPLVLFANETGPTHLLQWLDGIKRFRADAGV